MDGQRFKEIIRYSNDNRSIMDNKVKDFYESAEMGSEKALLNLMQIVRPLFQKKGYLIVEMPFSDKEIGALCYKSDCIGYMFLNTALPKVNVNFALCHEIYHVFYQKSEFKKKIELYVNEHYYENKEEFAANLFAGMLLMPEQIFSFMYRKFQNEKKEDEWELTTLVKLMSYFEAPYMAVLLRCCELHLLTSGTVLEKLMFVDSGTVRNEFMRLWLDDSILNATNRDNYMQFETLVMMKGREYQEEEYLKSRTVDKALQNMRVLYEQIRGNSE